MSPEATPGACTCGRRVLRVETDDGHLHTLNVHPADAASELRAWAAGRTSYTLSLRDRCIVAEPRTRRDIKTRPVGYRADRIVLAHQCHPTEGSA